MKRVALLVTGAFILILQGIAQSEDFVNIPDTAFLYALIDEGVDTDGDSLISFNEADTVISLFVWGKGITDMTGIEAFVKLDTLVCDGNKIRTLSLSTLSELEFLSCGSNFIDSLDVSNNPKLTELYIYYGTLTYLNASNNPALRVLRVKDCNLTTLDVSVNVNLKELNLNNNSLESLDLSSNANLEILRCVENPLESLDVSKNQMLKLLWCHGIINVMQTLDLSENKSLEDLNCGCSLTSLILPDSSALRRLNCGVNYLESVDVSGCPYLEYFVCYDNNITSLDLSNNPLIDWLSCEQNHLTVLDVSNNPELYLLWCGENQLTTLDLSQNSKIGSTPVNWDHLNVENMPSLTEVCVWDSYPGDAVITIDGSPNVCFEKGAACDGVCDTGDTTGIEGFDESVIIIYPNPTSDILTIETAGFGPHSIQLHTLNGQKIYAATFTGDLHQIDLSFCTKGAYILHVRSDDLTESRKVMKL